MQARSILPQALIMFLFSSLLCAQEVSPIPVNRIFYSAEINYSSMCQSLSSYAEYPRSVNTDGTLRKVQTWDWTSGFFPGGLWYLYETTGRTDFRENAMMRTAPIADQRYNTGTHDLGFMLYCSFGNALRITGSSAYAEILLDAANSLLSRFNPVVGCIRSWDFGSWDYPVIIDNMMNLELLFWASAYTGDQAYYDAAVSHARTTLTNHFREDNSSWHVVDYDPATGDVIGKTTHQGYSDDSHWARGQAWGLYGYTMCYRETGLPEFLSQAEKIAAYFMAHPNLPEDKVPYWDLLAPGIPNEPRDASASAIVASALIELSGFTESGESYLDFAEQILTTLSGEAYFAFENDELGFLLRHSTGHKPANSEVDTPINYADYYFLEALGRYMEACDRELSPYINTSEQIVIYSDESYTDHLHVYDVGEGDFTISVENDPGFVQINKVDGTSFELLLTPGAEHIGSHELTLFISDGAGDPTVFTKQVNVEKNSFPDLSVDAYESVNDNLAAYTLDGFFNTFWESEEFGSWITYDLGGEFMIDTVRMAFYEGDKHSYSFSVYSSLDGMNWTIEIYAESNGLDCGLENFGFREARNLRFVKIVGYGSDPDRGNRYTEVRFHQYEPTSLKFVETENDMFPVISVHEECLVLDAGSESKVERLYLYNMQGITVASHSPVDPSGRVSFPIDELETGVYLLEIGFESGKRKCIKFHIR